MLSRTSCSKIRCFTSFGFFGDIKIVFYIFYLYIFFIYIYIYVANYQVIVVFPTEACSVLLLTFFLYKCSTRGRWSTVDFTELNWGTWEIFVVTFSWLELQFGLQLDKLDLKIDVKENITTTTAWGGLLLSDHI